MEGRYKLLISGKNIYKEVELAPDMGEVRIGTSSECTVRLRRELFFAPVEITLRRVEDGWNIVCSDNLCFTMGDLRKLFTKKLVHGDELQVRYQEYDNEAFSLSYMIDFDLLTLFRTWRLPP